MIFNKIFKKSKKIKREVTTEIVSSIKNILNEDMEGCEELPKCIIPELQNNIKFKDIVNVLYNVYLKQRQIIDDKYDECLKADKEENKADYAVSTILNYIGNNKYGSHKITWNLLDPYCDYEKRSQISFECYYSNMDEISVLKEYIVDSFSNSEGCSFRIEIDPDISNIKIPYCDTSEVSDTRTIRGNYIDSNCDTWGSLYGAKAKTLYALYLTDIKKYAIVHLSYYVL